MSKKKSTKKSIAPAPAPTVRKARKKSGKSLANIQRRRKARRNPSAAPVARLAANPAAMTDFTHVVLPGFAAYGGTRVVSRIVYSLVQRKWPKWGKHAAALSGIATAAAAWFFAHKVKRLAQYHDGIIVGTSIAALQGIATTYVPEKYSWLLKDPRPEDVKAALPKQIAASSSSPAPETWSDEYSHLEEELAGVERSSSKRTRFVSPPKPSARPVAQALEQAARDDDADELDPDLTSELGEEDVDSLYSGSFAQNN